MNGRLVAACIFVPLLDVSEATGHGAVPERIDELTEVIDSRPNEPDLYEKRAELHALDENWTQAAEDLEEALALAPERVELMHRLADVRLQLGDVNEALRWAEAALARQPDHPRALLVRARARDQGGAWRAGADDLARLIAQSDPPSPELYRERAEMLARGGDREAAIATLRDGMARLGPLVTLLEPAVDLEAQQGRPDAALALVERLSRDLAASPRWQARRGELHELAGRFPEAAHAYRAASSRLERLPVGRRQTQRHLALERRLRDALARLPRSTSAPPTAPGRNWWALWPSVAAMVAGATLGYALRRRPR